MDAAAQAVLLQTDQILVKRMNIPVLIDAIGQRLAIGAPPSRVTESVATILEYSIQSTVDAWFERVEKDKKLTTILMGHEQRVGHLPKSLIDLLNRLRSFSSLGSENWYQSRHGRLRCQQGVFSCNVGRRVADVAGQYL